MPGRTAVSPSRIEQAEGAASADLQDDLMIGAQIRQLRKVKGRRPQQVAEAVGLSVGYPSQIERNRCQLPIGALKRIADWRGVPVNWFFQPEVLEPPEERDIVVRAGRRRMSFTGTGIHEELLSPNLEGPLEMRLSMIEPGSDSDSYDHDGAEAGFLVSGSLDLWVGERHIRLETGDGFSFISTIPHRFVNPDEIPTKIVWVPTPPHD